MGKKKGDGLQKSQETLRKNLFESTIITAVVLGLTVFYFGMSMAAYLSDNPRSNFTDLSGLMEALKENPFIMFPIRYNIAPPLMVTMVTLLFIFLTYTMDKLRIHNNLDTLKGSTEWANIPSLRRKYADYVESKHGHKGLSGLFL